MHSSDLRFSFCILTIASNFRSNSTFLQLGDRCCRSYCLARGDRDRLGESPQSLRRPSGLAPEPVEAVEDELKPPLELECGVIPGLGEPRDDLDEVRIVARVTHRFGPALRRFSGACGCFEAQ